MTNEHSVRDVTRILCEEAQTDTVGLWAVLWEVKQAMASASPGEIRRTTLAAVRDALAGGHVVAGQFVDQDAETVAFSPWNVSVDEVLTRIDHEWGALGREPNLGDIVWFVAPGLLPLTARKDPMGKDWHPS
jgi:hypothetical protein